MIFCEHQIEVPNFSDFSYCLSTPFQWYSFRCPLAKYLDLFNSQKVCILLREAIIIRKGIIYEKSFIKW